MRFAYSRWVGLLAGIFLFEIPCAAVESASLQDMLGKHLDRVMRKQGILLPTEQVFTLYRNGTFTIRKFQYEAKRNIFGFTTINGK